VSGRGRALPFPAGKTKFLRKDHEGNRSNAKIKVGDTFPEASLNDGVGVDFPASQISPSQGGVSGKST
jgi:hypothetical protein